MRSLGDSDPPLDDAHDSKGFGFEWLVEQNQDLTENVKKLQIQVNEWKRNANDAKERLNRVYQNRNQPNYVDSFYDSCYRKLINTLTEQNVLLKREQCIKDFSLVSELRKEIEVLRYKLDESILKNKQFEKDVEDLSSPDAVTELQKKVQQLRTDNSKQRIQYSNVKNRLNVQQDIVYYVRSEFANQRKEFIKLFTEHYLKYNNEFINQLKTLDASGNVPTFLSQPLQADVSTSTDNDSVNNVLVNTEDTDFVNTDVVDTVKDVTKDPYKDSGIDTLPDEFREFMQTTHIRELNDANKRIEYLEEQLKLKNEVESTVERLVLEKERVEKECIQLQNKLADANEVSRITHEQARAAWKEVDKCREDNASLQHIIQILQQDIPQQTRSSAPYLKARGPEVMEPHQYADHQRHMSQPILVRDCATKIDKSCPTETQDSSKYLPRGPPPPPLPPPMATRSKSFAGRKVAAESLSKPQMSLEIPLDSIRCPKCQRSIEIDKFGAHSMECGTKTI